MSTSEGRAVLDTSVARNLGYPATEVVVRGALDALRTSGFSLHVADATIVELTNQVWSGAFKWPEWERARAHLRKVIDEREPVLTGGLRWYATEHLLLDPPPEFLQPARGELRNELKEGWYRLVKATTPKEIEEPIWMPFGERLQVRGVTDAGGAAAILDAERQTWIDNFAEVVRLAAAGATAVPLGSSEIESSIEGVLAQLDARGRAVAPPLSVRLDAVIRVLMRYHWLNLSPTKDKFNPGSKKRRNDAIDYSLLSYLGHPALILTWDDGLKRSVAVAGSWQAKWILGETELRALPNAQPPQMGWPS
jgi:hypothetical protein